MANVTQSILWEVVKHLLVFLTSSRSLFFFSLGVILLRIFYWLYSSFWTLSSFNLDIPSPILEWINFCFWFGFIFLLIQIICKIVAIVKKFFKEREKIKKRLMVEKDIEFIFSDTLKYRKWFDVLNLCVGNEVVELDPTNPFVIDLVEREILIKLRPALNSWSGAFTSRYSLSPIALQYITRQILEVELRREQKDLEEGEQRNGKKKNS